MNNRVLWLRISYWTGAVIDGLVLIPLFNSDVWATINGVPNFHADGAFIYAQSYAAALMAGWTVLLLWADRKPMERRGVLLITVFPVIVGLNATRYLLYQGGFVPVAFTLSGMMLPIILTALFLFAYAYSSGGTKRAAA